MRDASAQDASAPTRSDVLGAVENRAGTVTGCEEGMDKEGEARKATGGIEKQSGTG
jgi:uncharacterized protein YjbJ (UPF0337 family)